MIRQSSPLIALSTPYCDKLGLLKVVSKLLNLL